MSKREEANLDPRNFKPAIVYTIYIAVHAREGVGGADDGRVQPAIFFRLLRSRPI